MAIQKVRAQQKWACRPISAQPCRRGPHDSSLASAACPPVLPELPRGTEHFQCPTTAGFETEPIKQRDWLSHSDQMTEAQTETFLCKFSTETCPDSPLPLPSSSLFTASVCIRATTPRETKEQVACGVSMREGVSCSARALGSP